MENKDRLMRKYRIVKFIGSLILLFDIVVLLRVTLWFMPLYTDNLRKLFTTGNMHHYFGNLHQALHQAYGSMLLFICLTVIWFVLNVMEENLKEQLGIKNDKPKTAMENKEQLKTRFYKVKHIRKFLNRLTNIIWNVNFTVALLWAINYILFKEFPMYKIFSNINALLNYSLALCFPFCFVPFVVFKIMWVSYVSEEKELSKKIVRIRKEQLK